MESAETAEDCKDCNRCSAKLDSWLMRVPGSMYSPAGIAARMDCQGNTVQQKMVTKQLRPSYPFGWTAMCNT